METPVTDRPTVGRAAGEEGGTAEEAPAGVTAGGVCRACSDTGATGGGDETDAARCDETSCVGTEAEETVGAATTGVTGAAWAGAEIAGIGYFPTPATNASSSATASPTSSPFFLYRPIRRV